MVSQPEGARKRISPGRAYFFAVSSIPTPSVALNTRSPGTRAHQELWRSKLLKRLGSSYLGSTRTSIMKHRATDGVRLTRSLPPERF